MVSYRGDSRLRSNANTSRFGLTARPSEKPRTWEVSLQQCLGRCGARDPHGFVRVRTHPPPAGRSASRRAAPSTQAATFGRYSGPLSWRDRAQSGVIRTIGPHRRERRSHCTDRRWTSHQGRRTLGVSASDRISASLTGATDSLERGALVDVLNRSFITA